MAVDGIHVGTGCGEELDKCAVIEARSVKQCSPAPAVAQLHACIVFQQYCGRLDFAFAPSPDQAGQVVYIAYIDVQAFGQQITNDCGVPCAAGAKELC